MGTNATGKTTMGKLLMLFTNYLNDGGYKRFTNRIADVKKAAKLQIDFVTNENLLYRFEMNVGPKTQKSYTEEDVDIKIFYTPIETRDSYETCASRLDMYECEETTYEKVNTNGWKQKAKDGGTTTMSMAYLTNGSGAINEEDMKFVDNQEEIDINDIKNKQVQTTVKDIRNFNSIYITKNDGAIDANKNKIKDSEIENLKEQIKEHISTSGSVKASIYMTNFDNNVHINLKSRAI